MKGMKEENLQVELPFDEPIQTTPKKRGRPKKKEDQILEEKLEEEKQKKQKVDSSQELSEPNVSPIRVQFSDEQMEQKQKRENFKTTEVFEHADLFRNLKDPEIRGVKIIGDDTEDLNHLHFLVLFPHEQVKAIIHYHLFSEVFPQVVIKWMFERTTLNK